MPVERYDLDRIALSEAAAHLAHARRQQALLAFEESGPRPVVDPQLAARLEVQHPPLPEPQALSLGKDQRPDVLAVEQPLQRPGLAGDDGAGHARLRGPARGAQLGDHPSGPHLASGVAGQRLHRGGHPIDDRKSLCLRVPARVG